MAGTCPREGGGHPDICSPPLREIAAVSGLLQTAVEGRMLELSLDKAAPQTGKSVTWVYTLVPSCPRGQPCAQR